MRLQLIVTRPGELPGLIVAADDHVAGGVDHAVVAGQQPLRADLEGRRVDGAVVEQQRRRPARASRRRADADIAGVDDTAAVQARARPSSPPGQRSPASHRPGGPVAHRQGAAREGGDRHSRRARRAPSPGWVRPSH